MNWDIVAGNWKQFKGKVKGQWGKLTDDQLDTINGKREELAGRIQEVYGINKDDLGDWRPGQQAAREALASLGVPEVILTLGSQGAVILSGDETTRVPAVPK